MRLLLVPLCLSLPLRAVPIGSDDFSYSDGLIAGRNGGSGFNYDHFDQAVTTTTSDWDHVFGAPLVTGGKLVTGNSGAKREYNGDIEGVGGGGNDGQDNHERSGAIRGQGRVFYRFDMTRGGGTWSGASSYDFGTERVFFGVPSAPNPASGNLEFGCQNSDTGDVYFSGIPASDATRTIITVLDFDHDFIGLWVDPDEDDFYTAATGANSCDAGGPYTLNNWSTAVRLASGAPCEWDHLAVATSWDDFEFIDPDTDDDGMPDAWELVNGLVVGIDDSQEDDDEDGLSNLEEYLAGTDPQVWDTDGDGFSDGEEDAAGTNPLNPNSYPGAIHPPGLVGGERFDYPDGPIAGLTGGLYWDLDNSTENDPFTGHTGTSADWDALFGAPQVVSGALVTQESGAKREYNGPTEGAGAGSEERAGAVNGDPAFASHAVYYKFEMTRAADSTWSGASSYDFGAERYLFGVPGAANPVSGVREFAIHDLNADQWSYSGIAPVPGVKYSLVAKLDFDADIAALYLNPDLDAGEASNTPVAIYPHTSDNWSTAIRLASGGAGAVQWDNVRVAHHWADLNDGPPVANDDSATMHHLGKARFKVLENDNGLLAPSSLTIGTPPTHGTATANPDGTILYQHVSGTPASDSFTYQIQGAGGTLTDTATVTVTFTSEPRFDSAFVEMPATPPLGELRIEDAFPGITFDSPHGFCAVPGDGAKLFVAEGDGRVFLIPDVNAPAKVLVLDHSAAVQHDNNELAMKGIAAHPDWAANGEIYVTYNSTAGTVRLSRFTCLTSPPYTAGPEEILIEQDSDDTVHNIGTCEFGPDGYLYVGFGDEGTQADGHNNSQHVDRNLWSCIIRIDVDQRPGSLPPNPDPAPDSDPAGNDADLVIPRPGGVARYSIPPDNPLVGATVFNGVILDPGQVRTEIFVSGLRNPWQFSAEDLDGNGSVDELWVGDVGRSSREELSVLPPGGNGGWGWREGTQPGPRAGDLLNGAPESAATLTAPLWDYTHGGGTYQGRSITGGHFYEPNLRFWSDHAEKKRWFLIQNTTDTVGFAADAPWTYPSGMIWVKHFDYPTQWESFTRTVDGQPRSDRRPVEGSPRRRHETRFLVKNDTGSYGLSYRWNPSQSDALLVDDDGESVPLDITLDGAPSNLTWDIPSRAACITCHTPEAEELISAWIREEVHPYGTYEEWRTAKFGNNNSLQGEPGENPEGDGLDNFGEWVFGTDPEAIDDFRATPQLLVVAPESGVFRFTHRLLRMHAAAEIDYVYRTSDNLVDWTTTSVIEESVAVSESDPAYETVTVSLAPGATAGEPRLFVKVEVTP